MGEGSFHRCSLGPALGAFTTRVKNPRGSEIRNPILSSACSEIYFATFLKFEEVRKTDLGESEPQIPKYTYGGLEGF